MLNRRQLLSNSLAVSAGLAVAPTSAAFLTGCARLRHGPQNGVPSGKAIDGRGSLKAHAAACGVLAGAAITASVLHSDLVYRRVVAEQYDIVVSENSMKWNIIHAAPDHFTF